MIAQAAGVAPATVSLALRNHARIPVETRQRIRRLADELGYVPNADISRLMSLLRENRELREKPVMALITDFKEPLSSRKPAASTWRGFRERAEALGYLPEEFHIGPGMTPRRLGKILRTRAIRALVFAPLRHPQFVAQMELANLSCAVLGNAITSPALSRCSSNKYANTLLACEKLWARGCRRIGLIVPVSQEERVEHTFLSGYLVFHHLHRHASWPQPLVDEDSWQLERILRWIEETRPDGILSAYPGIDLEMRRCKVPARQIPRTVVVNVQKPREKGIDQRHDLIAAGAVDLVDAQLKRNETGTPAHPKSLLIAGEWVV